MDPGERSFLDEDKKSSSSVDLNSPKSSHPVEPEALSSALEKLRIPCIGEDAALPSQSKPDNGESNALTSKEKDPRNNTRDDLSHFVSGIRVLSLNPGEIVDEGLLYSEEGKYWAARFETSGKLEDIDKGLECQSIAVALTPGGHRTMPYRLGILGELHLRRFGRLGAITDIDKAIAYQSQALLLAPDGQVIKIAIISNLGLSHRNRFERLGELSDINQAIAYLSQAVPLTRDGHALQCTILNNLGSSYGFRFGHLGDFADADRAIAYLSEGVSILPDTHVDKPLLLISLGSSLHDRFSLLGDLTDIERAITCHSQAASLIQDGHPNRPGALTSLGLSLRARFTRLGKLEDLSRAIACQTQAVSLTPDGYADKPGWLINLGNSYHDRSHHGGGIADVERAIVCLSQALALTPDGHADKPMILTNLGLAYQSRFNSLGDLVDTDQAIAYQSQALALTPDGHMSKLNRLCSLGRSYLSRLQHFGHLADRNGLILSYRLAAHCPTGTSVSIFRASRTWAHFSAKFDPSSVLAAYQRAINLIPQVVWIGATASRRYEDIHEIGDLAAEAAAVAISVGEYGMALEWLEAGRSIIWNQTLQLRSQFDDLFTVNPGLATNLQNTAMALEHAGLRAGNSTSSVDDAHTLEAVAQKHRSLAADYEALLSQARQVPGFQDYMRPKNVTELIPAAQSGPIVVVNVHASRCDALILRPRINDVMHVSLPDISNDKVIELQGLMQGYTSEGITERRPYIRPRQPKESLDSILSTLWHGIAKPVLASLGYNEKLAMDQLPHITWCATGTLAMLPLHAAGCYDQTGDNLFSYAISSYAPTLSSLLSFESRFLELGTILAIGQEATLPATRLELAHINRHARELPYLQLENHEATAEAVLDAMEQFSSVHFACHASQNLSRPLESCFHLHNRGLSLADITKRSLKDKSLAFLSACQTATGDNKSPDEAIHLAAGMLVAGYPSVIATMWSIMDNDAPLVADSVYGQLTKEACLNDAKVARALHVAVAALRDRVGVEEFARWVPYIHMGI